MYTDEISDSGAYVDWVIDIVEREENGNEIKDSEIRELNKMEYTLAKQYVQDHEELWRNDDFFVVTFTTYGGPELHGFSEKKDAIAYSQKLQNQYYCQDSNPYFIGHVFYKNWPDQNINNLIITD